MPSGKDKPPPPMVRLGPRGLYPVTPYDAEILDALGSGAEFDLIKRSARSLPHHRTYWQALNKAIAATQISPTPKHLHRELKLACGYTEKVLNRSTGEVHVVPDSIAFDQMTQDEFRAYCDTAMEMLASWIGYDPLRWMEAA